MAKDYSLSVAAAMWRYAENCADKERRNTIMTTKTDITLPPLPGATLEHPTGNLKFYGLETLKGYARAAVEADRKGRMPSDEEINVAGMPEFDALLDHIYEYGTASEGVLARANRFARALLSRYSGGHHVYVEARLCDACGHAGINDASAVLAACLECDWTGLMPDADHCPGCGKDGVMTAACPECASKYDPVAEDLIAEVKAEDAAGSLSHKPGRA